MLIVVEHRDVETLLQRLLDLEALRGLDVLQVDAADRRGQHLAEPDDVRRIRRVDLDIEYLDVCEALEQYALTFHHRLGGFRPDVTQPEHGSPVRNDGDQVSARGVSVDGFRVSLDFAARLGHSGRVSQGQVSLRSARLGGDDLDLPGSSLRVIAQRHFLPNLGHGYPLQFDGPHLRPAARCADLRRALTGPARGLPFYSNYPASAQFGCRPRSGTGSEPVNIG